VEAREQHNVANAMLRVLEAIDYPLCFVVRRPPAQQPPGLRRGWFACL
jgi:hypothetical protein